VAADVAGYSRLMGINEVRTVSELTARRAIMDGLVNDHGGRVVNSVGDSVLAEFPSASSAVQASLAIQRAIDQANKNTPPDDAMLFRIGIHLGEVIVQENQIFGDGVNVAARLQSLAEPGRIVISELVRDQVRRKMDLALSDLGTPFLKNIDGPLRAMQIIHHDTRKTGLSAPSAFDTINQSRALTLPDKPSIAVLPFQNMSGDADQDYFADGIVEEIITALSRFNTLFVIARNSSFTYKGRAVDVKQVGRELGVRYVLEGSVRKAANRVRIVGQLIDTATGAHFWANRFDGEIGDIFDLQDQVAESVVGAIVPAVEKAEMDRAKRKPTTSLDAYALYLRGSAKLYEIENRQAHDEASQLFHAAIELDPTFASAYARAAFCYIPAQGNSWISITSKEIAEVTRLAGRAVELGKDDAIALAHGGYALAYVAGDLGQGAALIDRALALNPNFAAAWSFGGWLKIFLGASEIAIEHFARAMRLSPVDPFITGMRTGTAYANFLLGRFDEAVSWAAMALLDKPDFQPGLRIAAASNAMAGRPEQALKALTRLRQLNPALRVSTLKHVLSPYRRPEDLLRYEEGLRRAGLPE
jgi:adenylate cyclase